MLGSKLKPMLRPLIKLSLGLYSLELALTLLHNIEVRIFKMEIHNMNREKPEECDITKS